ncbi:Sec-independent protein translocase subunit TatA [Glaciibacter sp. 2TAF33]|uniref:Sec-independent protein translocase subunit TatA n=1 Tax=Glaciibacter sp. 2TAF33 TaxID=3233015 RepID=UPI003F913CA1
MLSNLTGWHFLIILVVILLLFGAPKLPGLARSLGQSMKIFKSEIKSDKVDEDPDAAPSNTAQSTIRDETRKAAGSADTNPKP